MTLKFILFYFFCQVNKFLVDSSNVSFFLLLLLLLLASQWATQAEIGTETNFLGTRQKACLKFKKFLLKIRKKGLLLLMEDINQLMPGDRRSPQLNIKELEE